MATDLADMKENQSVAKRKATDFPAMLEKFLPEIKRALPQHLNGDRMARIALTAFRRTPKLAQCHPLSVFAAVIQASQLGLEPDTLGRSYLIPYGQECQFVPGWKGLVDLMNNSKQGSVWTGAVFDGDAFDYELGDSPRVKHKPAGENDPDKLLYVYAIGRVKDSDWPIIECWPAARVVKHRNRYNKVGKKHYSYENWEMYARKVVLLQVLKYMPCSPELAKAIALNDAAEVHKQKLEVGDAIAGSWEPVPDDTGDDNAIETGAVGGVAGGAGDSVGGDNSGGNIRPAGGAAAQGQDAGAKAGNVAQAQGAKNFTELTPAEYVDRINNAETATRVDDIADIARSRNDFTAEDKAFVSSAAKQWNATREQRPAQQGRSRSVD